MNDEVKITEEEFKKIASGTLVNLMGDHDFDGEQKLMLLLIGTMVIKRLHNDLFNHDDSLTIEKNDKEN